MYGRLTGKDRSGPRGPITGPVVITALIGAMVLGLVSSAALVGCGSEGETSTTVTVTITEAAPGTISTSTAGTVPLTSSTLPSPPTRPETTTSSITSTTTTTEALSSAETRLPNGNIRAMGFIDDAWDSGGARYISIDYAEMLTGDEAVAAAIEAGEIAPGEELPNDYFIRNVNPQLRRFRVSSSAVITTATYSSTGPDEPHTVTWAEFTSFWSDSPPAGAEHMHLVPWWIERDGDVIVSIAEQYLP